MDVFTGIRVKHKVVPKWKRTSVPVVTKWKCKVVPKWKHTIVPVVPKWKRRVVPKWKPKVITIKMEVHSDACSQNRSP